MEELLALGARVHTCCRNRGELDTCLQDWKVLGFGVTGSVCDVSKRAQREELMETVSSLFHGKLNILVSSSSLILHASNGYERILLSVRLFCLFGIMIQQLGS